MNRLLLNGDCNWINSHITNSTNQLIENWKKTALLQKPNDYFEIVNLESQLYRWSIDGMYITFIYLYPIYIY